MEKLDFNALFRGIAEDISVDPNTLTNLILNKNMVKTGFNWVEQVKNNIDVEDIYKLAPILAFSCGDFIRETLYEVKKSDKKEKEEERKAPEEAKKEAVTPQPEANQRDPNMFSSDPNFNACPAYLMGICRVDGSPCPFSNLDYRECGKYFLASSGDPNLMEIPVGREQDPSYAMGRKA